MSGPAAVVGAAGAVEGCPKRMAHGPCGGVRMDGGCEVEGLGCPFVARPTRRTALAAAPVPLALGSGTRPLVVADTPGRALDVEALRVAARAMVEIARRLR